MTTQPTTTNPALEPIYVASRASIPERGQMWRNFRAQGVRITSSWIDEDGEGQTGDFSDLWLRIVNEIRAAAALVLYAKAEDFPLKGALTEAGVALGMGKPVIVCLPDLGVLPRNYRPIGSWITHPLVTRCDDIKAAVQLATRSRVTAPIVAPEVDDPEDITWERQTTVNAIAYEFMKLFGAIAKDGWTHDEMQPVFDAAREIITRTFPVLTELYAAPASPAAPTPIRCVYCDHYGNVVNGRCQEIGTVVVQGGEAATKCDCECVFPSPAALRDETNELAKLRQAIGWICDAADAAYIEDSDSKRIQEIFNIAAKAAGLTRRLPDEHGRFDETSIG